MSAVNSTKHPNTTHGHTRNNRISPEYRAWAGIKSRCHNPKATHYADYGGRGIAICKRWQTSFAAFLTDMGLRPTPKHTVERIDNAKGYSPSNCRWATRKDQARNTRNNHLLTFNGETLCMASWAERFGLKQVTLWTRIHREGWSVERALTTPVAHCWRHDTPTN